MKKLSERDADMLESIEMWLHEIEPKFVKKELEWLNQLRSRLLSEEPDKSLKEAAEEYARLDEDGVWKDGGKYKGFIAGAEWQKQQDLKEAAQSRSPLSVAYANRCFENGKQAMKQQMLKDAVEGEVIVPIYEGDDTWSAEIKIPGRYEIGDKVRIVVLKEEEE